MIDLPSTAHPVIEDVAFRGGHGRLQVRLAYPWDGRPRFTAVIAGPHPYMGGDLGNNVVVALAHGIAAAGGLAVSFNYPGAGRSDGPPIDVAAAMSQFWETGRAPHDPELAQDTWAVVRQAADLCAAPLFAIGYSFGCWALAAHFDQGRLCGVVAISPTVARHDLSALVRSTVPVAVAYSDNDFATPLERMQDWLAALPAGTPHCEVPAGEHFFRGREQVVAGWCQRIIEGWLDGAHH